MCAGQKKNGKAAAKSNMPSKQSYVAKILCTSILSVREMPLAGAAQFLSGAIQKELPVFREGLLYVEI